ncbi:MAG: hypothetical protein AB2693_26190, partial [Candidatus Thiodiazotropha sp.]
NIWCEAGFYRKVSDNNYSLVISLPFHRVQHWWQRCIFEPQPEQNRYPSQGPSQPASSNF